MHPHRDMEILTWILEGSLEHRDSMGTGAVIRPGELQHMSAGTGHHAQRIQSVSERMPVHLLQIWILPERKDLKPEYEQLSFADTELRGKLHLVAGPKRPSRFIRTRISTSRASIKASKQSTLSRRTVMPGFKWRVDRFA